ncbi:major facilitator superfamily domain-containing protein [Exophiala viscosa]|uniref:major facilitator superfamily domain-containing protein n=1 Tax=Exophiala viscosa TaxID=2486360 RepID=UPI00218EE83C|nr:major facilitator superfamily domain-containing protein [Exophiala viscosa]
MVNIEELVRKIDLYLMPSIFVLYLFSFVDRANIGLAEVAGMQKALKLTPHEYYIAVILWVIVYFTAAVPSNMILSRTRPSIFLPIIMFLWGAVAAITACVTNASHLMALRFLLGVFEAGFSPAVLFIISVWYRKHEQSKRFFIFLSAGILSGAFGGVAAGAITSRLDGAHGIAGWRWLFLVEGVTTCGVALIVHWFLLDFPGTSKRLTPEERVMAEARLRHDGITSKKTEGGHARTLIRAFTAAALNWQLWIITPAYMCIIGALSISYFYPTLVKGLGYTSTNAQYMTAPIYLIALFVALPVCFFADRHPSKRGLMLVGTMAFGCIFSALTTAIENFVARYVFLCFINSAIWTGNALGLSTMECRARAPRSRGHRSGKQVTYPSALVRTGTWIAPARHELKGAVAFGEDAGVPETPPILPLTR